tara:strand:+ start:212 stop:442 length:231 start_codon:yes stop_codon:yes gene_type:complete
MTCECHLFDITKKETWVYDCQRKVNDLEMTMKVYEEVCKHKPPLVEINEEEWQRLKKIYDDNGVKYTIENGRIIFL